MEKSVKKILKQKYRYIERNDIQKKTLIIEKVFHITKLNDTESRMINIKKIT